MKKFYFSALTLCAVLGISAQEVVWQKDIKSSTQALIQRVYLVTIKTDANVKLIKK